MYYVNMILVQQINKYVCMYVYIHKCVYVCIHVCMYVCVCIYVCMPVLVRAILLSVDLWKTCGPPNQMRSRPVQHRLVAHGEGKLPH